MSGNAGGGLRYNEAQIFRQSERQTHANGNAFAVQQSIRIPRERLECVTERVPQVEQHPVARFGFIALDDPRFHFDTAINRVSNCGWLQRHDS